MKIGLLAYSSQTGLGYQTRDFYKHFGCHKVLIPDLSVFNGMPVNHSWCPDARVCFGYPQNDDCEWLVDGSDIIFICETPLNYHLIEYANTKGVPVVNQYNFEFCDYLTNPYLPPCTVMASPSRWGMDVISEIHDNVQLWQMPINTKEIPARVVNEVTTFLHVIGRPAAQDRNGTMVFLDAVERLGDKYNYRIVVQTPTDEGSWNNYKPIAYRIAQMQLRLGNDVLRIVDNIQDNMQLYRMGDVLVLPRRYGGLCLPMWEALASGVPVIMPDIVPNNSLLPKAWLVPAQVTGQFTIKRQIDLYTANVDKLVDKMNLIAENPRRHSLRARELAEANSWENRYGDYYQRFVKLCAK
jgi:glycosyltransferase involved in cell wall biosynthesis